MRFTESMEAYRLYSMGLYFCNKDTPECLSKAAEYFQQAAQRDPNYALAFAMLADTYAASVGWDLMIPDLPYIKPKGSRRVTTAQFWLKNLLF
jgi:hypothetical protein